MKKSIILTAILIASLSFAQGGGFNYKALITDNGNALSNQSVTIKFTVLENGSTSVYQETHTATTDANGIVMVNIGEGTVVSGSFNDIDWTNEQFLKTEINTGNGFADFGTTAFKAVPISKNAGKLEGKTVADIKAELDTERFNSILSRLDNLETQNTALSNQVTSLQSDVSTLQTQNTTLSNQVGAMQSDISNLQTQNTTLNNQVSSLQSDVSTLQTQNTALTNQVNTLQSKLDLITVTQNVNLDNLETSVTNNTANIATNTHDLNDSDGRLQYFVNLLNARIDPIETKTADMSIVHLTYDGTSYKTVRFSHVNVQIVNGTGATNSSSNGYVIGEGLGNLIIGYNEEANNTQVSPSQRTGYHNLIVGKRNDYTSYGGVVFGRFNRITAKYATVTGGYDNVASKPYSSISGGAQLYIPYGTDDNDNWFYWRGGPYHSN